MQVSKPSYEQSENEKQGNRVALEKTVRIIYTEQLQSQHQNRAIHSSGCTICEHSATTMAGKKQNKYDEKT